MKIFLFSYTAGGKLFGQSLCFRPQRTRSDPAATPLIWAEIWRTCATRRAPLPPTYWLVTGDDFALDAEPKKTASRQDEIVAVLPLAFRSSEGFARLYDSSCLLDSTRQDCRSAQVVLFPSTR